MWLGMKTMKFQQFTVRRLSNDLLLYDGWFHYSKSIRVIIANEFILDWKSK